MADIKKIGEEIAAEETLENISIDEPGTEPETEKSETKMSFNKQEKTDRAYWYVVYTYSSYENKVKTDLEKTVENLGMQDLILDIKVPMEETIEVKNGKKKHVLKKLFPGYVMVKMFLTDESWYVVRNTRGVTGFVGPGSKPVPLTDMEMKPLGINTAEVEVDFEEGDMVTVTGGVWKDTVGVIQAMNVSKQSVTINVELFGRETPVEISFADVKKAN